MKASNISALWIRQSTGKGDILEVLLNGVKQGFKQFETRKGKESAICRKQMWMLGARLMSTMYLVLMTVDQVRSPHRMLKQKVRWHEVSDARSKTMSRRLWEDGKPNTGDDDWHL